MATPKWLGTNVYNDSTHRFVTDTQISTWNSKAAGDHTHLYAGSASAGGAAKSVANSLTIQFNGSTQATYDGSAATTVNITPAAIGAAAKSHTHNYLPLTGGTISTSGVGTALTVQNSSIGVMRIIGQTAGRYLELSSGAVNATVAAKSLSDDSSSTLLLDASTVYAEKLSITDLFVSGDLSGTASSAKKVANTLTITTGSSSVVYNGSVEKTVNITPAAIGAATSGHTHNYAGSSSAGGAATSANKVNSALTIQFNGTTNKTFDGSAATTIDITPAAIGALGNTGTQQIINGNLNLLQASSVGSISVTGLNDAGYYANLVGGDVSFKIGAYQGGSFIISSRRADMNNMYVPKVTFTADSAFYVRGSILCRTRFNEDDANYSDFKHDDTFDNTRSIAIETDYRKFGIYSVAKGYTGLYEWNIDPNNTKDGSGWILISDPDNNAAKFVKSVMAPKIIMTATSGINWRSSAGTDYLLIGYGTSDNFTNFTRVGNTSYQMSLYTSNNVWKNGSKTTYFSTTTTSSDERLKERISDMSKYEEFFTKINPFAFKYHDGLYNAPTTKPLITWGYSAQETIKAFKECGINWEEQDLVVVEDEEALEEEESKYIDDGKLLKMTYQNMIPLNTHMIQKVMEENKKLKEENEKLESKIADLESKVASIMSKLDMSE